MNDLKPPKVSLFVEKVLTIPQFITALKSETNNPLPGCPPYLNSERVSVSAVLARHPGRGRFRAQV